MKLQSKHKPMLLLVLVFFSYTSFSQNIDPLKTSDFENQNKWVDSLYNRMTLKEKIGQLFMIQVYSNKDIKHESQVLKTIKDYKIGGIIFMKGSPSKQLRLNNKLQEVSNIPLLVGIDAEWGLSMRLDSTFAYPWNMTLGAIKNKEVLEEVGNRIGLHCKRVGVHFNFAPVVDINTNPNNPIIGNRSFGETSDLVSRQSLSFMTGMQNAGVLANAKHFPGHGDTSKDSHKTLPTINFSEDRIKEVELEPYRQLIANGLSSVMVAHLNVPSLEKSLNSPSSLSYNIVTNILKKELGFNGLIFTDGLNMKGAANYSNPGDLDLAAFKAGNDVLLIPNDVPVAVEKIEQAILNGEVSEERLKESVIKILKAKYKVGLNKFNPIADYNVYNDIKTQEDVLLRNKIAEQALTVIKNDEELLPITSLNDDVSYLKIGNGNHLDFLKTLGKYSKIKVLKGENFNELEDEISRDTKLIIGIHKDTSNPWKSYKLTKEEINLIQSLSLRYNVILSVFTSPYSLLDFDNLDNIKTILIAYQNDEMFQNKAAQLIFGAVESCGALPVSVKQYEVGYGINTNKNNVLSYGIPEDENLDSEVLSKIDSIVDYTVNEKMTPGAQVSISRNGRVVYQKNFGYYTYDKNQKISDSSIYDIASVTKIVSTLPLVMKMEEKGDLQLDSKLKDLLKSSRKTDKKNITLKEMLSHYARFQPWIPFYKNTLDSLSNKPRKDLYSTSKKEGYTTKVNKSLFLKDTYKDSINVEILNSDLRENLEYKYSDFPYYLLKEVIEKKESSTLDKLILNKFYSPLGMNFTGYLPYKKYSNQFIVPSEIDNYYRYSEIRGYVHDMGAAMLGGVGGHAGVFSNANDINKIMQMYLQGGKYGNLTYLEPNTINKFNTCYYCEDDNRRGVGFDKPQLEEEGPTCGCLSMKSFGHSGFTGTYTWADPEEQIVYVFLSNRTFPTASNNKLIEENIRTEIQKVIYESIKD